MTQPVYAESWANPPEIPATVLTPAASGPAPGTPATWMMSGGYQALGAADPTASPPALFRVYDRHNPAEAIRVTDTRADPLWQVIRGDQGTPVVDHAAGFEVQPLISAAGLDGRAPGVPSGNGLLLPGICSYFATPARSENTGWWSCWPPDDTSVNPKRWGGLLVPDGEAVPGSVYEATAWGTFHTVHPTTGVAMTGTGLSFGMWWLDATTPQAALPASLGNANIGNLDAVPLNPLPAQSGNAYQARWRIHGVLSITGDNLGYVNLAVHLSLTNAFDVNQPPTALLPFKPPVRYMIGGSGNPVVAPTPIVTTGPRLFTVMFEKTVWGSATCLGGKTWRAA